MEMIFKGLRGVPFRPYEGERTRCTARDFQSLAIAGRMYIACSGKVGELVIAPRIRHIPGAWQKWRSGLALFGRALNDALATVPDDQFARLATIFDYGEISIDLPKATVSESGGSVMAVEAKACRG